MTLSEETIAIVKSTAPVMKEKGVEITTRFYEILFDKYPVVKEHFNMANNKRRSQPQALAGAVWAYAANIDNLSALGPAVEKIAHKHASLDVKPEHYPYVGECLIQAVGEVLGPAVTPQVAQAWIEAYQFLADLFINKENQLRKEAAEAPGGWSGFRKFVVDKRVEENPHEASFYFRPVDHGKLPVFKAGQYLSFRITLPSGSRIYRNYSLSDRSGLDYLRVTIKREHSPGAEFEPGVSSNYFHDCVKQGDVLDVGPPFGDFFLKNSSTDETTHRPIVLLSAGIGLTPMVSMLNTLLEQGFKGDIYFFHSTKNSEWHALKDSVREAAKAHPNVHLHVVYTRPLPQDQKDVDYDSTERLSVEFLKKSLPSKEAEFYFCGPNSFQQSIERQLLTWGVPQSSINYEYFGPAQTGENPVVL